MVPPCLNHGNRTNIEKANPKSLSDVFGRSDKLEAAITLPRGAFYSIGISAVSSGATKSNTNTSAGLSD